MPLKPVLLMLFLMAGCMPPIHAAVSYTHLTLPTT